MNAAPPAIISCSLKKIIQVHDLGPIANREAFAYTKVVSHSELSFDAVPEQTDLADPAFIKKKCS